MPTRRLLSKRSKVPSTTASKRHRENVLTRKLRARYRRVTPRSNLRHKSDVGTGAGVRGGSMKFRNPSLIRRLCSSHAGRIALVAVPSVVASPMLKAVAAPGAAPVPFGVSRTQFQITSAQLEGTALTQYSGIAKDAEGGKHSVVTANINAATLAIFSQSAATETP